MDKLEKKSTEIKDTIVIKIGTSSLLQSDQQLNLSTLGRLVTEVKKLKSLGYRVVITTSGAVGIGCQIMNIKNKPTNYNELAALSGIGQSRLMVILKFTSNLNTIKLLILK